MIPGLNDEVCRRDCRLDERSGFGLPRKCSEIDVLRRRACSRSRAKIVSHEIRSSRSSFDHDNSITKGAVIVDGSPDMRELSVAELRTSHGVSQGINER